MSRVSIPLRPEWLPDRWIVGEFRRRFGVTWRVWHVALAFVVGVAVGALGVVLLA